MGNGSAKSHAGGTGLVSKAEALQKMFFCRMKMAIGLQ